MSGLTPEAMRAVAEWLDDTNPDEYGAGERLRAEANRLEAAAKTPGQVFAEVMGYEWSAQHESAKSTFENRAAAVIAHHVGPDRVVVDRVLLTDAHDNLFYPGPRVPDIGDRLREALS